MLRLTFSTVVCALALFCAGCSSYKLGAPATADVSPLFVAAVENHALAPQAGPLVTAQIREAIAKDGRATLAISEGDARAVLTVRLTSYNRSQVVARRDDTGLARVFAVTLEAELTVKRGSETVVNRRPIRVTREVFTDSGQQQAEYQNMALLAEALGKEIAAAVLNTW